MNQTITTGPGFHFASVWEPSRNPLRLDPSPTPDHPAVPEWCEKGCTNKGLEGSVWFGDTEIFCASPASSWRLGTTVNHGLAALRADRDRWREACRENQDEFQELSTVVLEEAEKLGMWDESSTDKLTSDVVRRMASRIRTLEADRDYWHEQYEAVLNHVRTLEAAQARQMAEIDRLTKAKNYFFPGSTEDLPPTMGGVKNAPTPTMRETTPPPDAAEGGA
jgi:hypothetical protein